VTVTTYFSSRKKAKQKEIHRNKERNKINEESWKKKERVEKEIKERLKCMQDHYEVSCNVIILKFINLNLLILTLLLELLGFCG